jgi:hypothetical protein
MSGTETKGHRTEHGKDFYVRNYEMRTKRLKKLNCNIEEIIQTVAQEDCTDTYKEPRN